MRLFVAVFPPPEVQNALAKAARALPDHPFRLTPPVRIHLTLKFLGETEPGVVPHLIGALEPLRDHESPFEVGISGLGVFPSPRGARILWAGVGAGSERLASIAEATEALLEPEGFPQENRPFVPHLTLGRARRPAPFDPAGAELPGLGFAVGRVDLVRSEGGREGVAYSTVAGYDL